MLSNGSRLITFKVMQIDWIDLRPIHSFMTKYDDLLGADGLFNFGAGFLTSRLHRICSLIDTTYNVIL